MSSCPDMTKRFRKEHIESGHQFSIHTDFILDSIEPAFKLHGRYPGGDCVVFASDELIYD